MMTAEQLKNSILQLAMQGKLVEQRPEEGTGEELYKKIQTEKEELVKEGKIKRLKDLPNLTEEYDIPDTWRIAHLINVCESISDIDHKMPKAVDEENGIPFLAAKDINLDMTLNYNANVKYISISDYERLRKKAEPREGDIIFSRIGSLGKVGIVNSNIKFLVSYSCCVIRPMLIDRKYLAYCLQGPEMQMNARKAKTGIGVPDLGMAMIKAFALPLPPLAEQKRIVAKIEELMPFVEQYAAASSKLNTLNASFPEMMKKSILQEAVQGKLVPQDPNDEPASVLLGKIAEEKKRLIKEGKIKKQKPLPAITENEIPFDIPESWEWCYVGDLFDHNTGKAMNSSAKQVNKKGSVRRFITTSNLYWNRFDLSTVKEMFFSDDELARCTATKRDILMCEGGAYFGRTAIWNYNYDICFQNHVHRLRPYVKIKEEFFYYLFYFYRTTGLMKSKGTAMPGLSSVALHGLVIPLPPLAEQERIVSKIEELLPCAEQLSR